MRCGWHFAWSLSALLSFSTLAQSNIQWNREVESDEVFIKTGTNKETGFPIFEANVSIEASVDRVLELLTAHEALSEYVYGVAESNRLDDSAGRVIVYYELDLPWPIRDKYGITEEVVSTKQGGVVIDIQSVPFDFEPEKDLSRLAFVRTKWQLIKVREKTTKVIYRSEADPGSIPNWVVNLFIVNSPKETLKNIRRKLENRS